MTKSTATKPKPSPRRGLLISSTTATLFAIAGHLFLGFEQAFSQMIVALLTGYSAALAFEWIDAKFLDRTPRFMGGGPKALGSFLLSAHMTSITTSFLLFIGSGYLELCFAVTAAIGSKYLFRLRKNGRLQHFLNPSNFGIALTLLLFPTTTVIPYEYTEGFSGWSNAGNWILPLAILLLGTRLNAIYTRRLPVIVSWLSVFVLQALVRSSINETPLLSSLAPATGVAFILFTFYMVTDPMTSPSGFRSQVLFGAAIGVTYGALISLHVIYTLFFAVSLVCIARGVVHAFDLVPSWALGGVREKNVRVASAIGS